jgi:hypothetical protein
MPILPHDNQKDTLKKNTQKKKKKNFSFRTGWQETESNCIVPKQHIVILKSISLKAFKNYFIDTSTNSN